MTKYVLAAALYAIVVLSSGGLGDRGVGTEVRPRSEDEHEHGDEEPFHHLGEELQASDPEAGLEINAITNLLVGLGETCLTASQLFGFLGTSESSLITEDMFTNAAIISAYFLRRVNCTVLASVADAQAEINATGVCRTHLQSLLDDISATDRVPVVESMSCFSAADVLQETCADHDEDVTQAFASIFVELLEGRCVLPSTDHFVDEVFELYHGEEEEELHEPDLTRLLTALNITAAAASGSSTSSHEGHDHRRRRRSADDDDDHDHEAKCYSVDEFFSMGQYDTNSEGEKVLTKVGFQSICPAMLFQIVNGVCAASAAAAEASEDSYNTAQKYGYGTAAVAIISSLAFIGLLLFQSIGTTSFQLAMQFFIAVGIGTLSGDALLHLIPEVVGLHAHGAEEEEGHEDHEEDKTYLWRLCVVVVGIYIFYLFENALKLWNRLTDSDVKFHNHDHGKEHAWPKDNRISPTPQYNHYLGNGQDVIGKSVPNGRPKTNELKGVSNGHGLSNPNGHTIVLPNGLPVSIPTEHRMSVTSFEVVLDNNVVKITEQPVKATELKSVEEEAVKTFCGYPPIVAMVFLGDALHNFGDGIAIGAAFSSSWTTGIGTSIAIFCHELPHEFGDFAIYVKNGMEKWKALFLNFGAACCCFIGLYIGLGVSEHGDAREWLLAVIAGMFLYISLVDIMHEMTEENCSSPFLQFFLQNLGLLIGWAILLLIAFYEDNLRMALA